MKCGVWPVITSSISGEEENDEEEVTGEPEAVTVDDLSDSEHLSDSDEEDSGEGEENDGEGVCLLKGQAPIAIRKDKKKPAKKKRRTKSKLSSAATRRQEVDFV